MIYEITSVCKPMENTLEILHHGNELSQDEIQKLRNFNQMYDNWVNCANTDATFIEMQNKIKLLLKYLLMDVKKGNGLFQICKKRPMVQLRSIPYDVDEHNNIILSTEDAETEEVSTMLIHCINNYSSEFSQEDFETLGAPIEYIIENREELEKLQKELFSHQDVFSIYEDEQRSHPHTDTT